MELTVSDKKNFYERFKQYLEKYGHLYSESTLEYINESFENYLSLGSRTCIMNQIYAALDLLPDKDNLYKAYMNILKKEHNIYANVLEIGGGYYPIMSKYIDEEQQQIGKGNITVYEPKLVVNKLGNVKLIKKEFTIEEDISNYDLVIGIMPCKATEMIISESAKAKIPFFIALCGCTHFPEKYIYYQPRSEEWHSYIYYAALDMIDSESELKVEYLDPQYEIRHPIISSHKKVKTLQK